MPCSERSEWNLCRKIHFPVTTLVPAGRDTRLQVLFHISVSYSSFMALYQLGSLRATRKEEGIGLMVGVGGEEVARTLG